MKKSALSTEFATGRRADVPSHLLKAVRDSYSLDLLYWPLECTSEEPVVEVLGSFLDVLSGTGTPRHDSDVTWDGGVGNTGDTNRNRLWFDPECDRCSNGVKDIAGAAAVLGVDLDLELGDVGQVLFGDCEPGAEDAVNTRF